MHALASTLYSVAAVSSLSEHVSSVNEAAISQDFPTVDALYKITPELTGSGVNVTLKVFGDLDSIDIPRGAKMRLTNVKTTASCHLPQRE